MLLGHKAYYVGGFPQRFGVVILVKGPASPGLRVYTYVNAIRYQLIEAIIIHLKLYLCQIIILIESIHPRKGFGNILIPGYIRCIAEITPVIKT